MQREGAPRRRAGEAGFTVIEMVVALIVTIQVILAVLLLFDFANKLSRVQGNVADMQQAQRVAQYDTVRLVRMLGRGELPCGPFTVTPANPSAATTLNGVGISVRDNVPAGAVIGAAGSPAVVAGSDVLTIRGVFSTPIYNVVTAAVPAAVSLNQVTGTGTITLLPTSNGVPQSLTPLITSVQNLIPEALVLIGGPANNRYSIVELDPATSNIATPATSITIGFRYRGGTRTANYNSLVLPGNNANFPLASSTTAVTAAISRVGILEEYRIYVRSATNNPSLASATDVDLAAALSPKLSRARTFPNNDDPYGPSPVANNAANLSLDVADDVTDLQVALGFDSPLAGDIFPDATSTAITDTGDDNDDWLFNAKPDLTAINVANWNSGLLYYIRLSMLARTARPDPAYTAPLVDKIEDHLYNDAASGISPFNQGKNLMFRRRLLQTVVAVRNAI